VPDDKPLPIPWHGYFILSTQEGWMATFPTPEWLTALKDKLNSDETYAHTARNWEGDMKFIIEPAGTLSERITFYLDLWHGKCRDAFVVADGGEQPSAFTLKAPYDNFARVMKRELDPIQAMLTRRLSVQGNMVTITRNVPTVLDFVRCCREVTDNYI
jgi:putative sterol carrier protein